MSPFEETGYLERMRSFMDESLPPDSLLQPEDFQRMRKAFVEGKKQPMSRRPSVQQPDDYKTILGLGPLTGLRISPSAAANAWEGLDVGRGISQIIGSSKGWFGEQFDNPELVAEAQEEKRLRDLYSASPHEWSSAFGGTIDPDFHKSPAAQQVAIDLPGQMGDITSGELASVGESAIPMAGGLAAGSVASILGAPALVAGGAGALLGMAPTIFGPMYERAVESGMDHEDATWDAVARTAYETVPEMFPFLKLFGKAGKSVLGKVAQVAGAEGVSEVVTGWLNTAHDYAKTGELPPINDIIADTIKNFELGVLMGGPMATPVAVAQKVAEPYQAADNEYIRQALTEEAARKGFTGPDAVQFADLGRVEEVDPETGEKTGVITGREAEIEEGSGRVTFDDVFIQNVLDQQRPGTRKEAKELARQLLQHEGTAHGGMFAWFNSAPSDSGIRSSVNSLEDYLVNFDQANPEFVNNFLNTERGRLYANKNRTTQIKEAIAISIAEGNKSGVIRGIISKVKLLLKRATGFDFSEAEIRDILRSIDLDLRTGRLQQATPDVAIDEGAVLASELEAQEESREIPQKWRELDTPELQELMESNRAQDNPIWVAQNKELDNREIAEQEVDTDAERYVETVDEIMSIYDADAPAFDAARDGTLNSRIISYAAETPFTREELWEGVNQRMEATEDPLASAKRIRKPKSETLQRDINDGAKKARQRINKLNIEEDEKATRIQLLKRLQNIMGAPARKRGIDAGDQDVFIEQAAKIVDGNLTEVEEFIAPFEAERTAPKEKVYKADARRAQRAKKLGKTDAEILKYRPKGARHPMEGKMTYPFAQEEINRQEEAGEITPEEAEIRRLAVNNVRRIYTGKAGPTVKRTLSEAVYGIGNYEDLVPWSEVYTEAETTEMGERAEVAQAEARRTRYDPTDITDQQKNELLEAPITAEEASWIDSDQMPSLETREERLLFLRAPTEFKSLAEQKEFEAWRDDQKGFVAEDYKAEERAKRDKLVAEAMQEGKVTRIPAEAIEKIKETQRTVTNYVPSAFERLRMPDYYEGSMGDFEIAGREYTEQGELINDAEMQIVDTEGTEPLASQKTIKPPRTREESLESQISSLRERAGMNSSLAPQFKAAQALATKLKAASRGLIPRKEYNKLAKEVTEFGLDYPNSGVNLKAYLNDNVNREPLRYWETVRKGQENISAKLKEEMDNPADRQAELDIYNIVDDLTKTTGINWSPDHMVALNTGGLDFAWNIIPLPSVLNEKLASRRYQKSGVEGIQKFFQYLNDNVDKYPKATDVVPALIDAAVYAGVMSKTDAVKAKSAMVDTRFPVMSVVPPALKGKTGLKRILAAYDLADVADIARGKESAAGLMADAVKEELYSAKKINTKNKDYTEHFNDSFWYKLTSFLWGKPVQAIRDFNKSKRFGSQMGDIKAASKIADLIQRAQTVTKRTEGLEYGTDMMQDVSMRSGEFFSQLARIFASVTDRPGDIPADINKQLVDHLVGRSVKFSSPEVAAAAKELDALVKKVYKYGRDETSDLKERLNLRGEGDTTLPRVWNIEYLATRKGKAEFLKVIHSVFSDPKKRGLIFADAGITADDIYNTVINSGGFVQGDWTNVKADQTRSSADIAKDERIQEILDSLPTEAMIDEGLVLDDVQAIIPRFIQKAIERTEYSKRFGINDELLRGMIQEGVTEIRENNKKVLRMDENSEGLSHIDEKAFEKAVWDMSRILRNQYGYDMANMSTRKWLQRATNTMTMMKLPLVTLASIPEFFTPMLKGDVRPDKWFVDFMAGTTWAGYKAANGMSKLLFNKHLPAMRKAADDIKGLGVIRDVQILRELGIADIQAMGDLVATRYANPNFARGGLRAGAKGTIAEKVPKKVRAAFNMQTYMQGTLLTTITEMQQLMAYRNFQRHIGRRLQFMQKHKGKKLTTRRAKLFKQFRQDLADYGITTDINLDTPAGQAEFNAGALRFVDQVITRPNDATTAKAFKNPLIAPLVLFKRFITTYGNTLMTALGNDFATKVDNKERAKMLAKVTSVAMVMYGSVMFAEVLRGAIKGDLDEEDFDLIPDWNTFVRRLERTGLGGPIGAIVTNLGFPYKRGWWDTTQSRIMNEILGPIGGTLTDVGDTILSDKEGKWTRLVGQLVPTAKPLLPDTKKRKKSGVRREVY